MRVLLDTCVALWAAGEPEKLSHDVRTLLTQSRTRRIVSAATAWEVGIKVRLNKLELPQDASVWFAVATKKLVWEHLAVTPQHALYASELPLIHKDPFDRLLIAQAAIERIPVITAGPCFAEYDITVLSATQ